MTKVDAKERRLQKRLAEIENQPPPGPRTKKAIDRANERSDARSAYARIKTVMQGKVANIGPEHSDPEGFRAHLFETLGTGSDLFASELLMRLETAARPHGAPEKLSDDRLNALLALFAGIAPATEFEAVIAEQIVTTHLLSMDFMARARQATTFEKLQICTNAATKLSRTMVAQTEALTRLRSGGKQQVIVKHVYVNGNAIVADTAQTVMQGGGDAGRNSTQPHAPAAALVDATSAAVLCEDPFGRPLSVAGGAIPQAVPAARG